MRKNIYLILAITWMAAIWGVSSLPSTNIPEIKIIGYDKIAHFSVYMILGLLVNKHLCSKACRPKSYIIIYALLILSAALDEYHQNFIPGRSVNIFDFFANTLGLISALLLALGRSVMKAA